MNGISLFTGPGVGEATFKQIIPDYRTVAYVEWDKYCQEIIRARIKDGILDDAPIFGDIREFNRRFASLYADKVHFISGGFPCQPFSVAGKNKGAEDERNMWPATIECISIIRPQFCLLENVPNLLTHEYTRRIFGDLAEIGYDAEWDVVSAAFVGAPHLRKRVWILAYTKSSKRQQSGDSRSGRNGFTDGSSPLADTEHLRPPTPEITRSIIKRSYNSQTGAQSARKSAGLCQQYEDVADTESGSNQQHDRRDSHERNADECSWWSVEPRLGRVAHGVAHRVDRLKCLGNGWVPQVVARILEVRGKE